MSFLVRLIFLCSAAAISYSSAPDAAAMPSANSSTRSYDAPAFEDELKRISAILARKPDAPEIAELRDSLPKSWTITTPQHTYSVSTQNLRNFLTALDLQKGRAWVEMLAAETTTFTTAQPTFPANARAELTRILSRREFAAVHPPSTSELLRERIAAWFQRLLTRFFGGLGRYPTGGKILFWFIVIGGVLWIVVWMLQSLARHDRMHHRLDTCEPMFPAQTWQEWLRSARESSARGDFRQAIHATYWAGIVRLQDVGIVPQDGTRTPREYLRLASRPASGELAARSSVNEALSALTSRLERTWYADRGATLEDFQDSLRQLEALGCPLE
jgi:hypothetical protein